MASRFQKAATFCGALLLLAGAGCVRVPPSRINVDRMDFGQVIQQSWKRQTLLNIVRLRFADPPMFLDVASVISSYTLGGNVSAGASLQKDPASSDSMALGASGYWSNTPTVTYQPLMGDRFTRSLLQPVPPAAVFQLMQGGLSPDLIMRSTVRSINGLHSDVMGVPGDPGYMELVRALTRLQNAGGLGTRIEARKDGSALIMIVRREAEDPARLQDVEKVRQLLGLELGLSEIEVVFGFAPRSNREVAMVTRTMLGIIMEMGSYIEVPPDRAQTAWKIPAAVPANGEDRPEPLIRIRSGNSEPGDAYVAVPYQGHWYWIENADIPSKRTFTFLMILFSLAETGQSSTAPVVTVPSR